MWTENGPKMKISLDLLEILHTNQFEGSEFESGIGI